VPNFVPSRQRPRAPNLRYQRPLDPKWQLLWRGSVCDLYRWNICLLTCPANAPMVCSLTAGFSTRRETKVCRRHASDRLRPISYMRTSMPAPRPDGSPKVCLAEMVFGEPPAASNPTMRKNKAIGIYVGKTRDPRRSCHAEAARKGITRPVPASVFDLRTISRPATMAPSFQASSKSRTSHHASRKLVDQCRWPLRTTS
jgi:hypothetical protein